MKNTELFSKYQKDNVFLMFLFSKGKSLKFSTNEALKMAQKPRVSVQGVESLWGDCRFIPAVYTVTESADSGFNPLL